MLQLWASPSTNTWNPSIGFPTRATLITVTWRNLGWSGGAWLEINTGMLMIQGSRRKVAKADGRSLQVLKSDMMKGKYWKLQEPRNPFRWLKPKKATTGLWFIHSAKVQALVKHRDGPWGYKRQVQNGPHPQGLTVLALSEPREMKANSALQSQAGSTGTHPTAFQLPRCSSSTLASFHHCSSTCCSPAPEFLSSRYPHGLLSHCI